MMNHLCWIVIQQNNDHMRLIFCDTHAHLYLKEFDKDRPEMIQRAIDKGVTRLFLPNIDSKYTSTLLELCALFPKHCFPMMGMHPCSVKDDYKDELSRIEHTLVSMPKRFCAIGEIGLDYYWDTSHISQQKESLTIQINWAKTYNLPIVLHCRNSHSDVFDIVKQHYDDQLSGVFHCFSGNLADAEQIVRELPNFYIGIGGVVTYKKGNQAEVVAGIDMAKLVLETDAPYLSPEPYRSSRDPLVKRNESAYIPIIAQKIAEIKGLSLSEVAEQSTLNALRLFKLDIETS